MEIPAQRWIVLGAAGQVGSHVVRELMRIGERCDQSLHILALVRCGGERLSVPKDSVFSAFGGRLRVVECDLADGESVSAFFLSPEIAGTASIVVNCAGLTAVAACFSSAQLAHALNSELPRVLALHCSTQRHVLIHCSTDMVFSGDARGGGRGELALYSPTEEPAPLSVYGASKLKGEQAVLSAGANRGAVAVVVRLPLMYGVALSTRYAAGTFVLQLRQLTEQHDTERPIHAFADEFRTPMSFNDAARSLVAVGIAASSQRAILGPQIVHLAGPERLSRLQMLQQTQSALVRFLQRRDLSQMMAEAIEAAGFTVSKAQNAVLVGNSRKSVAAGEPRPADLSMRTTPSVGSHLLPLVRPMAEALDEVLQDFAEMLARCHC